MNKRLVVRQNGYKDCAAACLVSIMRYYNVFPSYEEISYHLNISHDGTNAYNIINGSRKYGFDGIANHYTYEDIINKKLVLPVICHIIKNNMYHFIVLYKVNKNTLEIMDPSSNITRIKKSGFKKIFLNTCIYVYPIKVIVPSKTHKSLFKFIIDYLVIIKKDILISTFISLIVVILNLTVNFFLTLLIDLKYNYNLFILLMIVFIIMSLLKNILSFIKEKMLNVIENNIISKINVDIIIKLFNLPYLFFKNKQSGEIEARLDDLSSFRDITTNIIVNALIDIIFVICSFIILFIINKTLLFISLIEIIFYLIICLLFKNIFTKNIEELEEYESDYKKSLNESINGYETNRNINLLNQIIKNLEVNYISFTNKMKIYNRNKNIENTINNIFGDILYIILLFIEVKLLNNGLITIGNIILFNTTIYYFKGPLKSIIDLNQNIIYLKNIYKRINDLFVCEIKKDDIEEYDIKGDIIINNLSYSINNIDNIFENINLKIEYKSKYLIYGSSGSGKSTLMKVLLKYLDNYKGDILINNINLKDISSSNISYNFTYVSQNNYLNNDTLKNNIIYNRNINNNEYEKVIHLCNLDNLRDSKINRNMFVIEDNGFNISGGERQKIILARSLLKKSNYIILDEALSEVSSEEEIDIMNKIFEYFKEKTIIYISHRKEVIDMFNMKYKLERSKE